MARPRIEMIRHSDSTANPLRSPDREILVERRSSLNRRSIGAGGLVDVVGSAVSADSAFEGSCGAGIVVAVGFDDVVFNQWRGSPAVDA